jgi:hypothetical protein
MLTFLLVLGFAFALVLGNVMMLRPSARDKAMISLRETARREGLQVRLLPAPDWLRSPQESRLTACYTLFLEEGAPGLPFWRAEQVNGEWQTRSGDNSLLVRLELPPEASAVLALEAQANAVHLYWSESLGAEALPAFFFLLRQVIEKLKQNQ